MAGNFKSLVHEPAQYLLVISISMALSAEPGRKAPYSNNLRLRIVWQKIGKELSCWEIANNLNVSTGTVSNILKRFEETGKVNPTSSNRQESRKLGDYEFQVVIGLLLENPTLYLHEICSKLEEDTGISVSTSTVCRIIKSHGFSRKQIQQVALQRSVETRAKFMAKVQFFNTEQFVWLDETGCDKRDYRRKYGYSIRGTTWAKNSNCLGHKIRHSEW